MQLHDVHYDVHYATMAGNDELKHNATGNNGGSKGVGYRMFQWIISIFSLRKMNEAKTLMAAPAQHVCGEEHAHMNGGRTTMMDYSASPVDGPLCDVGLDWIPKGVRSPVTKSRTSIKQKSKIVKTKIPTHSHTFASKRGRSSQRTRAAAGAFYHFLSSIFMKRDMIRNRNRRCWKKVRKQRLNMLYIEETDRMVASRKKFNNAYLKHNVVVFDGGDEGVPNLIGNGARWACTRIESGGLEVCHPPNTHTGITYEREQGEPVFMLLPREEALKINSDGKSLCEAMIGIMKAQKNVKRGKSKMVFSESKYCCVGSKPRRNAPGVEPGAYKMEDGVECEDWDELIRTIKRGEHAFNGYVGTNAIRRIREARKLVGWETAGSTSGKSCNVFNAVAFGMNVHLRAHVDHDFTYLIIQAHVDGVVYGLNDPVLCYFCFPAHGIAVPLRPGDVLLINALEYHCVSSRCRRDVDVFVLSCYLKTAVVGGNDNKRKLTEKEIECLGEYDRLLQLCKKQRR